MTTVYSEDTVKIGYLALANIKYELRTTFEAIKEDPMNFNLLMEHIAKVTGSVDIMSRYLADRANTEEMLR